MTASMPKRRAARNERAVDTMARLYPHVRSPPGPLRLIGVSRPSLRHEAPYVATVTALQMAGG